MNVSIIIKKKRGFEDPFLINKLCSPGAPKYAKAISWNPYILHFWPFTCSRDQTIVKMYIINFVYPFNMQKPNTCRIKKKVKQNLKRACSCLHKLNAAC